MHAGFNNYASRGLPGQVQIGPPKDFTNNYTTNLRNLFDAGILIPEILDTVATHYSVRMGLVGTIFNMRNLGMKGFLDQAKMRNALMAESDQYNMDKTYDYFDKLGVKTISNQEFSYRMKRPHLYMYKITQTPVADGSGFVGANAQNRFQLPISSENVSVNEIYQTKNTKYQFRIISKSRNLDGGTTAVCEIQWSRYTTNRANIGIPVSQLTKGSEIKCIGNQQPEKSHQGSRVATSFSDWKVGAMNTSRWEWSITGHAKHVKANVKEIAIADKEGGWVKFWAEQWQLEMFKTYLCHKDESIFWGRAYVDEHGQYKHDHMGRTVYSGDGIYEQMSRQLLRTYNKEINDFTLFDDLMADLRVDGTRTSKPTFMMIGGHKLQNNISNLIKNEFGYAPQVLLYNPANGGFFPGDSNDPDTALRGIKTNFNYYETNQGAMIVANTDYFDSKNLPTYYAADGSNWHSRRGFIFNLGELMEGDSSIDIMAMAGRQKVMGRLYSMAHPGPDGAISTAVDQYEEHMLDSWGVKVDNPNMMAELQATENL